MTGTEKPKDAVAMARDNALDREREEKAIDTLHYFVVFILGPHACEHGWYFCSGGSVFGLSFGDVGFFDENRGRYNHIRGVDRLSDSWLDGDCVSFRRRFLSRIEKGPKEGPF